MGEGFLMVPEGNHHPPSKGWPAAWASIKVEPADILKD